MGAVNEAISSPAMSNVPKLPPEVFKLIVSCPQLNGKDLKAIRLVNHAFKDFSTPILFNHAFFSINEENLRNFRELAEDKDLCKYVQTIYIDSTFYHPGLTPKQYANEAATYFERYLGEQKKGPFTEKNLHLALACTARDSSSSLTAHQLSGRLRSRFIQGYVVHAARADFAKEFMRNDGVFDILADCLPRFSDTKSIELLPGWPFTFFKTAFTRYLKASLPEESFELIDGKAPLDDTTHSTGAPMPVFHKVPGVAARTLHAMYLPPCPSTKDHVNNHSMCFQSLFRALHSSMLPIRELVLPADPQTAFSSNARETALVKRPFGLPAQVITAPPPTTEGRWTGILGSSLRKLRRLELVLSSKMGGDSFEFVFHGMQERPKLLGVMIRSLRSIEDLSLIIRPPKVPEQPRYNWTIKDVFLTDTDGDSDQFDDGDSDGSDDEAADPNNDAIQSFQDFLTGVFMGYPGPINVGSATGAPTPPANGGINAPPMPFNTLHGGMIIHGPPFTIAPETAGPAATTQNPFGTAPPSKTPRMPPERLFPNPWPKLRKLTLSYFSSETIDLLTLCKTVSPSLRHLTLHHISLAKDSKWTDAVKKMQKDLRLESCDILLSSTMRRKFIGELGGMTKAIDSLGDLGIYESDFYNTLGEYIVYGPADTAGFPANAEMERRYWEIMGSVGSEDEDEWESEPETDSDSAFEGMEDPSGKPAQLSRSRFVMSALTETMTDDEDVLPLSPIVAAMEDTQGQEVTDGMCMAHGDLCGGVC